jgi:hypothetical protein
LKWHDITGRAAQLQTEESSDRHVHTGARTRRWATLRRAGVVYALALTACINMYDCGGEGEAGQRCEDGRDCASGVCLSSISCRPSSEPISICASGRCDDGCAPDEACIRPFGLSHRYCYPLSACDADAGPGDPGERDAGERDTGERDTGE